MVAQRFVTLDSECWPAGSPGRPWDQYTAGTIDYYMARRLRTKGQPLLHLMAVPTQWTDEVVEWRPVLGPVRFPKAATCDVASLWLRCSADYDLHLQFVTRARQFTERAPSAITVTLDAAYQDLGPWQVPLTRGATTEDLTIYARQASVDASAVLSGSVGAGDVLYTDQIETAGLTPHAHRNSQIRLYDTGGNLVRVAKVVDNTATFIFFGNSVTENGTVRPAGDPGVYDSWAIYAQALFGWAGLQLLGGRT